jgi:hypothetical protein
MLADTYISLQCEERLAKVQTVVLRHTDAAEIAQQLHNTSNLNICAVRRRQS